MNETYMERMQWILKEGLVIAVIIVFWHAVAVLLSQGVGNIAGPQTNNMLTLVANQLATAAVYVGILSAVLYVLVRAGIYLIDYWE